MDKDCSYIKRVLDSFNTNYDIVDLHFTSEQKFNLKLHVELPPGDSSSHRCDIWKERFAKATHTGWIVKDTFPSAIAYIYRKVYVCHHSSFKKSKTHAKLPNYTKYRDRQCLASIDIKIQKQTKDTIKKYQHIKEGRTATIKVIII